MAVSRDLGGSLSVAAGQPPSQPPTWDNGGDGTKLNLYFVGHMVTYQVQSHALVRSDLDTNSLAQHAFTVARNIDSLQVAQNGDAITIQLDFGCYYSGDQLAQPSFAQTHDRPQSQQAVIMRRRLPDRRGYALMLVVVFSWAVSGGAGRGLAADGLHDADVFRPHESHTKAIKGPCRRWPTPCTASK